MKDFGTTGIENFITLGSPHSPPPNDKPGVFDQTRGILSFCEQEIPGTYHSDVHSFSHSLRAYACADQLCHRLWKVRQGLQMDRRWDDP